MSREGVGLLQGRVVCGVEDSHACTLSRVDNQLQPCCKCTENPVRRAGKPGQSIRGSAIDDAIGSLLLESVARAVLEVALADEDEISRRVKQAAAQL